MQLLTENVCYKYSFTEEIIDRFMFGIFFRYSVNEGRCWFKHPFTNRDFTVTGLVTEPGGKTMRFSLWGFTLPSREWQVITVDFENVLKRACKLPKFAGFR